MTATIDTSAVEPTPRAPVSREDAREVFFQLFTALSRQAQSRHDGWQNIVSNLGVEGRDPRLASTYERRKPIDRATIERLYEQDDIFPLIIDRVPEHATRRWIKVTGTLHEPGRRAPPDPGGDDPAKADRAAARTDAKARTRARIAKARQDAADDDFGRTALEALEELDAQGAIYELLRLDRLYGGAAIILGADDGQKPDKPLDTKRIRKVEHLNVVSRWEITASEIDRDPTSKTFRQPLFYTTVGASSLARIHHTRVIRLRRHRIASDFSRPDLLGWDLPIAERVYEPVRQFGSLYAWTEVTFQDLTQGVMSIEGLAEMLSADQGDDEVITRLKTLQLVKSALNMIILDKGETYDRRTQVPSGLADLIVRMMDRLAAASEMPLSILFGQAPTGLSTDDASGRRAFYDGIRNKQTRLLRRPITRILDALIAARSGPFAGRGPAQWSFDFLPLEEPNEKEDAERRHIEAMTDDLRISKGVITPEEARSAIANDATCRYQLDQEYDDAREALDDLDEDDEDDLEVALNRRRGGGA